MIIKQDRQHVVVNDTPAPEPRSLATKDTRIESTCTPFFPNVCRAPRSPARMYKLDEEYRWRCVNLLWPIKPSKSPWLNELCLSQSHSPSCLCYSLARSFIYIVCLHRGRGDFQRRKRSLVDIAGAENEKLFSRGERLQFCRARTDNTAAHVVKGITTW